MTHSMFAMQHQHTHTHTHTHTHIMLACELGGKKTGCIVNNGAVVSLTVRWNSRDALLNTFC